MTDPTEDNIDRLKARWAILEFFKFRHLPDHLQAVSAPFAALAVRVADRETRHPAELAAGLRKLLEAKDCAVRAAI